MHPREREETKLGFACKCAQERGEEKLGCLSWWHACMHATFFPLHVICGGRERIEGEEAPLLAWPLLHVIYIIFQGSSVGT